MGVAHVLNVNNILTNVNEYVTFRIIHGNNVHVHDNKKDLIRQVNHSIKLARP